MKLIVPIIYDVGGPVIRATVRINTGPNSWITDMTRENGLCQLLVDDTLDDTQFEVYSCSHKDFGVHINLGLYNNLQIRVGLVADPARPKDIILPALELNNPSFPEVPTRDAVLSINLAFQGTYVNTNQYGLLPWFEPALAWLNEEDRQNVYAEKKNNGETHCIVFLPSGPALYDEPNQPYNVFGPLDWTNNNTLLDNKFVYLIAEVILNGFFPVIFLGGDDGQIGYFVAIKQLPLVVAALRDNKYKIDFNQYCVIVPGFDGVFYGYTPEQITLFGQLFRSLGGYYLGIEHSTGHIPIGNGPNDYRINGPMSTYDVILGEFNTEQKDDTVWQVLARMLGSNTYVRPSDQPVNDDTNPPFYLKEGTKRGPYYYIVFEYDTYHWVRGMSSQRHSAWKRYLTNCGPEFVC